MDGNESVVLYTPPDGAVKVNVVIKNETLWLTQAAMAELFGVGSQAISKYLKDIYAEGELSLEATCSKMEQVQNCYSRGGRYNFGRIELWRSPRSTKRQFLSAGVVATPIRPKFCV